MNFDAINGLVSALTDRGLWLRIGIGASGISLIIIGIIVLVFSSKAVTDAVGSVAQAGLSKTPAGAATVAASKVL